MLVKIFQIYQQLIFDEPDEVYWKLSNLIKDRELLPEQVNWLLEHHESSTHILNRIFALPSQK